MRRYPQAQRPYARSWRQRRICGSAADLRTGNQMARYAPLPASHRPAKGRDIKIEREMETMSNLFNKAQGTALELAIIMS